MNFKLQFRISGSDYNCSQTITIKSRGVKKLNFEIPDLKCDSYKLVFEDIERRNFRKTVDLKCMPKMPVALLTTNKSNYKIGDLFEFRVLFLDENLQPMITLPTNTITTCLKDSESKLIQQWEIVDLKNGIFNGKYQLPVNQTNIGKWKIEVSAENQQLEEKSFELDKVVKPKLNIKIQTAKNILLSDISLNINLLSSYCSGEPVNGNAVVSLKIKETQEGEVGVVSKPISVINGKAFVNFKIAEELKMKADENVPIELIIQAELYDKTTVAHQTISTNVQLHSKSFVIEGVNVPKKLITSAEYTLKIALKDYNGRPVTTAESPLKLFIKSYDSIYEGTDIRPQNVQHQVLESIPDQFGISRFEFSFFLSKVYHLRAEYLDVVKTFETIKRSTGPFNSIQLESLTANPSLNSLLEVYTRNSDLVRFFAYTIAVRGKCLKSELVQLPDYNTKFMINIIPTMQMFPSVMVFVHYNNNEQLRLNKIQINFEKDLDNEISTSATTENQSKRIVNSKFKTQHEALVNLLKKLSYPSNENSFNVSEILEKVEKSKPKIVCDGCFGKEFSERTGILSMTNADVPTLPWLKRFAF